MRYLALALFAGVWTATALYAFPAIDDGWLWMLEDEKGYSLIADSMSDRPFIGEIWQWLSMHGLLWPTAPLIHFATWFGFGVVTMKLYERLDPTSPRLATCAGVLCLSAIPFEEKHVLVTYTWTSCISVLLVYVALLIELRSPEAMPGSRSPRKEGLLLLLQAAIIVFAGVLTEYTVGALIAASMLILAGSSSYQLSIRTRCCVVCVYAIAGVAGLAVLNWFKPAQMVDHYSNPVSIVRSFDLGDVIRYPLLLISGIWNLAAGSFLKSFGSMFAGGFKTGLPVAAGFIAFGVCWVIQLRSTSPAATEKAIRRVPLRVLATVLACIATGTLPVIAMNFAPHERFLIPVLPFAAIATVLIADVVIGAKLRWLCLCVLMFVATYATAQKVTKVVFLARSIRNWGEALHPRLSHEGRVVALFTPAGSEQLNIHWFEFTPQLSMSWAAADRHRFLAFANLGEMFTHVRRDASPPSLQLRCTSRRFERSGTVNAVYFLVVREDLSVDFVRNNVLDTEFIAEGKR